MGLIYLDTCVVIYLAERHPQWCDRVTDAVGRAGNARFAISPLVKMECVVGPVQQADPALQRKYGEWFAAFQTLQMIEPVFLEAAVLRARFCLKTPDALHVACAQHHRCDALWTNDNRLAKASRGLARRIGR